ncbi:MAG: hypothetical protein OXL41_11865 [Nitrospinae bacterium]|nr:hypothetical protein [Nitrospinota bacterium]
MMMEEAKRVFVVCSDLMFSGGIRAEGSSQGILLEFIDSEERFQEALDSFRVTLFMSDLHHHKLGGERAGELVKKLKASEKNKDAHTIAWGKHTEPELLKSAMRAGFDKVVPRSLFVKEMPGYIRQAARGIQVSE